MCEVLRHLSRLHNIIILIMIVSVSVAQFNFVIYTAERAFM